MYCLSRVAVVGLLVSTGCLTSKGQVVEATESEGSGSETEEAEGGEGEGEGEAGSGSSSSSGASSESSADASSSDGSTSDGSGASSSEDSSGSSSDGSSSGSSGGSSSSGSDGAVCTPNAFTCMGNDVYQCEGDGSVWNRWDACGADEGCSAADGRCLPHVCTPDELFCMGNDAHLCAGNGLSSTLDTACTGGDVCVAGICENLLCTPDEFYCKTGDVYLCDTDGMGDQLWTSCTSVEYCDDATATCEPQVCTPDAPACDGDLATTCNSDGSGYLPGGTDCSATGEVCSSGACSSELTEAVGTLDTLNSVVRDTGLVGTYYDITTTRNLDSFEIYVDPLFDVALTWVVYEGDSTLGTYDLIWSAADSIDTTEAWYGTPTINVELTAGKSYLLGLSVDELTNELEEVFYDTPGGPVALSFGTATGWADGYTSPPLPNSINVTDRSESWVTIQRVTTN